MARWLSRKRHSFASKRDDLTSVPRIYRVEGEYGLLHVHIICPSQKMVRDPWRWSCRSLNWRTIFPASLLVDGKRKKPLQRARKVESCAFNSPQHVEHVLEILEATSGQQPPPLLKETGHCTGILDGVQVLAV